MNKELLEKIEAIAITAALVIGIVSMIIHWR